MDETKKRKSDSGIRRYISPGWAMVLLLVFGFLATLISSIKAIPALAVKVEVNTKEIAEIKTNYLWIREDLKEIKGYVKK